MEWWKVAIVILCAIKTIEFGYRFYKWLKKNKNL